MQESDIHNREGFVARVIPVERGEWGRVLLSAGCFFFLLFGYFLLRPIREAMGVQRSMDDLRWLFLITCGVSLLVTLAFGSVVSRLDRRRFITLAYRAVMACLVGFVVALLTLGDERRLVSGYIFYVWLSVVNLFITSVFWAFMADVWRLEQGKRLYATIGIGGTIGAILGSGFVWWLADQIPAWVQVGAAIVAFELAVRCVHALDTRDLRAGRARDGERGRACRGASPIGGSWRDGVAAMARSPYLLGIGAYIVLVAVSSTMIYFTGAQLVSDASDELERRVALFAQLDLWTQVATLLVQLFVTARIIRWLGVGVALAALPVLTCVGFAVLAWVADVEGVAPWQVFAVFAAFQAAHRATRYALVRPARETLFSVVSAEEKYKAKPVVDVFLYRGGDVAGTGVERAIAAAGLGLMGMAMVAAPLAVLWGSLAFMLAWSQQRRAGSGNEQQDGTTTLQPHPGAASLGKTGSTT